MRYQRIFSQFWHDEKIIKLSEDARYLFLYLMTSPHSNSIGCYVLPKKYIEADLGWSPQRLGKPFGELLNKGLILFDETVNLLIIRNHINHNPIENPNQRKGAEKIIKALPQTTILQQVKQLAELLGKPFIKPFGERLPKPEEEEKEEEKEEDESEKHKFNHQNSSTTNFQKYINENYPNIAKLPKQITANQFLDITERYNGDDIKAVLDSMENYKKLLTNYVSVGLTLKKWLEKEYGKRTKYAK